MKQPDFKKLNKKFPMRNWGEVWERIQRGEEVPTTMKEAIDRYMVEVES